MSGRITRSKASEHGVFLSLGQQGRPEVPAIPAATHHSFVVFQTSNSTKAGQSDAIKQNLNALGFSRGSRSMISATTSKTKNPVLRIAPKCILHRFPPEIRKLIFDAVLDLFFEEHEDRRQLHYYAENSPMVRMRQSELMFAGHEPKWLPGLELALLPDTMLHGEFIVARVQRSIITLTPEVDFIVEDYEEDEGLDDEESEDGGLGVKESEDEGSIDKQADYNLSWPLITKISPLVRRHVRVVVYVVLPDTERERLIYQEVGYRAKDRYGSMEKLASELQKLLIQDPASKPALSHPDERPESRKTPSEPKLVSLIPRLQKLVIRFPEATALGGGFSFYAYQDHRALLWSGLKAFVEKVQLKCLELEDSRDYGRYPYGQGDDDCVCCSGRVCTCCAMHHIDEIGHSLMSCGGNYFDEYTKDLNTKLDLKGVKEVDEDVDYRPAWPIYIATETWTAKGEYLVWED